MKSPNKAGHGPTLAPHLGLLELASGNRPVESGAQLLGCLQGQLNPGPRPGVKASVDKVERDDIAQRRMARVSAVPPEERQLRPAPGPAPGTHQLRGLRSITWLAARSMAPLE